MRPIWESRILPCEIAYFYAHGANQFLIAAKHLCAADLDATPVKLPRLHLLCQGLELLFKAGGLLTKGMTIQEIKARRLRHNLSLL